VTTVRIVHALRHNRPAQAADGSDEPDWRLVQRLVVLADDAGRRAVPLWLRVYGQKELTSRVGRPAADAEVTSGLLETAARLLRTAGTAVSALDIEPVSDDVTELRWDTVTVRVELATRTRPVTVSAEYGLALAAVAGAPIRVPDALMGRLAVPVPGEDVLAPFLPPADTRPAARPARRFEPRNMTFTAGLDYWELAGNFSLDGQPGGADYSGTAAGQSAVLAATVPAPDGSAVLAQAIFADDYRGRTVTLRGQLRTTDIVGRAGLHLAVSGRSSEAMPAAAPLGHGSSLTAPGSGDWTWHEVTVPVTSEATAIQFGIFLAGGGRIELRSAELTPTPPGTRH
jgi:hypothetical protein